MIVSPETRNSSSRICHGPMARRPSAIRRRMQWLRAGSHLEVVVDGRGLAVEREPEPRVVLHPLEQLVDQLDEPHPEDLERLVPLAIPVGVRDQVDDRLLGQAGASVSTAEARLRRATGDDPLRGHDVGPTLDDARLRCGAVHDQAMEGEKLLLERLGDGSEARVAAGVAGEVRHVQIGRGVEQIRGRELELDRRLLRDDADLLSVRGVVRQEVPADRESGATRELAVDRDRRRPDAVRPDVDGVDGDRVTGEGADEGQLVDDAAEHDVRVQAAEGRGGRSDGDRLEPVALVAKAVDRRRRRCRSVAAAGERGRVGVRSSGGGRGPRSSGSARRGPRPRRRPGPRRPPGRTASCSRPGGGTGRRPPGGPRSRRPRRASRPAASRRRRPRPGRDRQGSHRRASPRSGSSGRRGRWTTGDPRRSVKRFAAGTR